MLKYLNPFNWFNNINIYKSTDIYEFINEPILKELNFYTKDILLIHPDFEKLSNKYDIKEIARKYNNLCNKLNTILKDSCYKDYGNTYTQIKSYIDACKEKNKAFPSKKDLMIKFSLETEIIDNYVNNMKIINNYDETADFILAYFMNMYPYVDINEKFFAQIERDFVEIFDKDNRIIKFHVCPPFCCKILKYFV